MPKEAIAKLFQYSYKEMIDFMENFDKTIIRNL